MSDMSGCVFTLTQDFARRELAFCKEKVDAV